MKSTILITGLFLLVAGNLIGQVSQSVTAADWSDGSYKWWKSNYSSFYLNLETEKKDLKFTKNDKGEVTEVIIGESVFVGDEQGKSEYVRYFQRAGSDWNLFFKGKYIVIFKPYGDEVKILGCIKAKCKASDKAFVTKHIEENKQYQEAELNAYADKKKKANELAALEKEAEFSIKNKSVKSIDIVDLKVPEKFGHFRGFSFDVAATLTDGKVLSTKDGGFRSDYITSYSDGYDGIQVGHKLVEEDKITATVISKYDDKIKTSKDVILLYNEDISFSYNGLTHSMSAGSSASNYKIEIKQTIHKINKSKLLMVRITNMNTGVILSEFKMGIDQTLKFYCVGGSGGSDNGRGSNGADGGSITVIKDPNVEYYNLSYKNQGGRGGAGSSRDYNGRDGRDGTFKEESRAVTF